MTLHWGRIIPGIHWEHSREFKFLQVVGNCNVTSVHLFAEPLGVELIFLAALLRPPAGTKPIPHGAWLASNLSVVSPSTGTLSLHTVRVK